MIKALPAKRLFHTNILLYAYDFDAEAKGEIAVGLLAAAFARPAEVPSGMPWFSGQPANLVPRSWISTLAKTATASAPWIRFRPRREVTSTEPAV